MVLNCSNKENKKTNFKNTANTALIVYFSEDSIPRNKLEILSDVSVFGRPHPIKEKTIKDNNLNILLDSVNKPLLMELMTWDKDLNFKQTDIYVFPGDTIKLRITNEKIIFEGNYAEQNNLLYKLNNTPELEYGRNPYLGSLDDYKRKTKTIYKNQSLFLEDYIKSKDLKSDEFIEIVKNNIYYEYLYNLIAPRHEEISTKPNYYFNSLDGLRNIIGNEYYNNEITFNYDDYLDNVTIEDFKKVGFQDNYLYKDSFNAFIRYYFESSNYDTFTKEKLESEIQYVQDNLEGKFESYVIARILRDYNTRGFGYSKNNVSIMTGLIDKYKDLFEDSYFKKIILEIKEDLNAFDFKFSDSALGTKLLTKSGDTTSLKEVFLRMNKKNKVIEFWASYCSPSISEIQRTKSFKDKVLIENDVEWIYLSIDKNQSDWLRKTEELKSYFNVRDEYLVIGGTNSSLAKFLKVKAIPRYIIIDKNNQLILNNAPRPSKNEIFEKIIKNIN